MTSQHDESGRRDAHDRAPFDCVRDRQARLAVTAVRGGDTEAFGQLVELYQSDIMSLSIALLRNVTAAEELAQDVFVRAFRYLHTFDDRKRFYPWLATIAYRLAQTRWRERAALASRANEMSDGMAGPSTQDEPLAALIRDEQSQRLWKAVRALPFGQRVAAVLYYQQGMDIGQVAGVLGVSVGTVKTCLFRARRSLHTMLQPPENPAAAREER
ncbi:MAG TPA: sigma-70 family RNA polymerase sigma factor [Phycisphaerae bacterium]|nr:sigma-70 family RNA polymerase sigma factor [Phycisphaerae bacterium]